VAHRHGGARVSRAAARGTERRVVTKLYVRVLLLEAAILVALYLFGRAFS
jgi:hypothetical protein